MNPAQQEFIALSIVACVVLYWARAIFMKGFREPVAKLLLKLGYVKLAMRLKHHHP